MCADAGAPADAAAAAAPAPAPAAGAGDDADDASASESEEEVGDVVATSGAVVVDDSTALEAAVDSMKAFLTKTKDALAVSQQARQIQTNSALPLEGALPPWQ